MLYLDYNATRPLNNICRAPILAAMDIIGNPSSVHGAGRAARKIIETAREDIGSLLNVQPKRVIFTSGATESNNIALKNYKGPAIISTVEHDSVFQVRPDANLCPVDSHGIVDLNALAALLTETGPKTLVSIIMAHNETGVVQPMSEISDLVRKYHGVLHTDAVQAMGRIDVDCSRFDMISFSGHKIGAPAGVGILVINPDVPVHPVIVGGGQERSYRSGTENLIGIAALPSVLKAASLEDWSPVKARRDAMEDALLAHSPDAIILGKDATRLPNTTLITMPGVKSETQVMNFDMQGVCVSAGSACSSGKVKMSRTLKAMGYSDEIASSALRISLGIETTEKDINEFITIWRSIYDRLHLRSAS